MYHREFKETKQRILARIPSCLQTNSLRYSLWGCGWRNYIQRNQYPRSCHRAPCLPFGLTRGSCGSNMQPSSRRCFWAIGLQNYNSKEGPTAVDAARLRPLKNAKADAASLETLFKQWGYRSRVRKNVWVGWSANGVPSILTDYGHFKHNIAIMEHAFFWTKPD